MNEKKNFSLFEELGLIKYEKTYENFIGGLSGGNKTNVKSTKNITKKLNLQTDLNRSMVVKGTNNIVNKTANSVAQKNSSTVQAALGAENSIFLNDVKCNVINITGINQDNKTKTQTQSVSTQKQQNTIDLNIYILLQLLIFSLNKLK